MFELILALVVIAIGAYFLFLKPSGDNIQPKIQDPLVEEPEEKGPDPIGKLNPFDFIDAEHQKMLSTLQVPTNFPEILIMFGSQTGNANEFA